MKQTLKTKFNLRSLLNVRWMPMSLASLLLFTAVVAQPVQAVSIVDTIKCNSIAAFAVASESALKVSQQAMQATFDLTITVMQTTWKLEDQATSAIRQVSESVFTSLITAFSNRPGLSTVQKAAVVVFRDLLLKSVQLLETNIDAAEAAYREDMLALVKSHEAALTDLVNTLVANIDTALTTAQANCSAPGVVVQLTAVIASATATLLTQSLVLTAQSIAKAVQIVATRNLAFLQQDTKFFGIAASAVAKLTSVILFGG